MSEAFDRLEERVAEIERALAALSLDAADPTPGATRAVRELSGRMAQQGRFWVCTPLSLYSDTGHVHSAADITSGTLSTDRYSAYTDLGAESKIGTGATQVAAGDHNHTGVYQPIFGTQAYVISNDVADRTFDPSASTLQEIGNVLATLIRDFNAGNRPAI